MERNFDSSEDPGFPEEAESDRYGEHAKSSYCRPVEDEMDTEVYGHEEADRFVPEQGGGSHDNQVCRDWRPYEGSRPAGLACSSQHVQMPHLTRSGEDVNGDQHEVKEPLQCTDNEGVDSVMSENSQPLSVQSMSSSSVEETRQDGAVRVTLSNSGVSRHALTLYDELCVGVRRLHGNQANHCVEFVEVVQEGVKAQNDTLLVPVRAPFPCLSMEDFLCTPGFELMVENGSLSIMSALLRYIRAVWKCHGVPNYTGAMYGAFSGLGNILFSPFTQRLDEPDVCLQPSLHNFVEAVEKTCDGWFEKKDVRDGRLLDIRAVGNVLSQILPFIQKKERLHISVYIQRKLEQAIWLCTEATTGQEMANIVRTLECDQRRLSMLHLEGLRNAVDIVCYEGEKIHSVTNEWMKSCGAHPLLWQRLYLHYNGAPQCCVLPDHEVCHPESSVTVAAAVT